MAEALTLGDRIGVMDGGRLIWRGTPQAIARVRGCARARARRLGPRRFRGRDAGETGMTAVVRFWLAHQRELATLVAEHVLLVAVSTAIAVAIGVPLAIFATRRPRLASPLVAIANVVQTIPSLAMFGFLLPVPLIGGVGARAALVGARALRAAADRAVDDRRHHRHRPVDSRPPASRWA